MRPVAPAGPDRTGRADAANATDALLTPPSTFEFIADFGAHPVGIARTMAKKRSAQRLGIVQTG